MALSNTFLDTIIYFPPKCKYFNFSLYDWLKSNRRRKGHMINMADREDLQTLFDRQRAVSWLEEATQFLREYSGGSAVSNQNRSGENSEVQPAGSRRNEPHSSQRLQANHTRFSHTTTTASSVFTHQNRQGNEDNILSGSLARNSAANGRVHDNFRSLFSPYGRETSSTSSSSVQSLSAGERRKRNTFFFKRETWTHEFFCLADKDQMVVPSRSLKVQLQETCLGRKKVCLNGTADATEVKTTLEESYPKLKEGGGFEILRRGPSLSELTLIPPPPSGYTVKFLRDSAGFGQAIAFVRPLQCNLNREAIKPVSDHSQVGNQRIILYLLRIFFKGYRGLAREMKILFYCAK